MKTSKWLLDGKVFDSTSIVIYDNSKTTKYDVSWSSNIYTYTFPKEVTIEKYKVHYINKLSNGWPKVKLFDDDGVLLHETGYNQIYTPTQDATKEIAVNLNKVKKMIVTSGQNGYFCEVFEVDCFGYVEEVNKYLFKDEEKIKKYILNNKITSYSINLATPDYNAIGTAYSKTEWAPKSAFDSSDSTYWLPINSTNVTGKEWIGYDFTNNKNIRKIIFNQWTNYVTSVKVQRSSDNINWIDVATFNNLTQNSELILPKSEPSRYWRMLANSNTNNGAYWGVAKIEMMEAVYSDVKEWQTIGTAPVTQSMFDTEGMTDLSILDNEAIQGLTYDTPELLCWTDEVGKTTNTDNLIPVMTSDTSPSGKVEYSSQAQYDNHGWKAFDGDVTSGTTGGWWTGNSYKSGWLSYEFMSIQKVVSYSITSYDYKDRQYDPKNWTFEGWNGSQWIVLDTQINQYFSEKERKLYSFSNSASYLKYRINVSSNFGSTNTGIIIQSLEMFGEGKNIPPSRTTNLTAIPKPQLLLPIGDIEIGEIESIILNKSVSGSSDLKVITSGDSGVSWKGKTPVNLANLLEVKANGFTPEEFNALTKQELATLFPNGKARFAFYIEQEKLTDIAKIDSLSIKLPKGWVNIGNAPVSQDMLNNSMNDLAALNRSLAIRQSSMAKDSSINGPGIIAFKSTIDLKQHPSMRNITIETK